MNSQNEIILYKPNDKVQLEVRLEEETVWLTQVQLSLLFGVDRTVIGRHLRNIFLSGELIEDSTCAIFAHMGNDGKQQYHTKFYNLDAILSVGYRVNSINATLFRKWANSILKDYILKGYAITQRFERLEYRMTENEKKIDLVVKTALPPKEGVFYNGQIFDAFVFVADLIKTAKKGIILIDNYLDESVLMLLAKRKVKVKAIIYTKAITPEIQTDLAKHNAQYPEIFIEEKPDIHDRFLLIDGDVYHIGASFKDLGKKLFAFSKMEMKSGELLKNI
ncbi:MAG: virulence RhuM family protein [Bacteroidales bacterium]|jgi:hypothetical protein|nr:virulence RhuM family protein [Bacteroidales bacterium]